MPALRRARSTSASGQAARWGRCTACRWRSRTSSTRPTSRPSRAASSMPAGGRCTTPRSSPGCGRPARSCSARRSPPSSPASRPGKTRNPHDLERTPGGSSSGSAAAVAAGDGAIGDRQPDQRLGHPPASFCGVVGFKPSYGLIPRTGVLTTSATLDHVGVFARSVEDAALLADVLAGWDEGDPTTRPDAAARLAPRRRLGPAGAAPLGLRAWPDLGRGRGDDDRGVCRVALSIWATAWSRWRCRRRSRPPLRFIAPSGPASWRSIWRPSTSAAECS